MLYDIEMSNNIDQNNKIIIVSLFWIESNKFDLTWQWS